MDKPVIQDGTCKILCKVQYLALMFRPFKDQVVYAAVSALSRVGIMCEFGPMKIFLSASGNRAWHYREGREGGQTEAGLTRPERYVYELNEDIEILPRSLLCLRISGIRQDEKDGHVFHALGTINDDGLGIVREQATFVGWMGLWGRDWGERSGRRVWGDDGQVFGRKNGPGEFEKASFLAWIRAILRELSADFSGHV